MEKTFVYAISNRKGNEGWIFPKGSDVEQIGGLAAAADYLRANTLWYWPFGEIEVAPEQLDFKISGRVDVRLEKLIFEWLEAGAPIIRGAIGTKARNCTPKFVSRYLLYIYCEGDGVENVTHILKDDMQKYGSGTLEAALTESTAWYYCIGEVVGMNLGNCLLNRFSKRQVGELIDSWRRKGSPKNPGKLTASGRAAAT